VFIGDAIYDDLYHGPRRLTAAQIFPLLDRLLALEADYYIGGHDPEPVSRAAFVADAQLLQVIGSVVAQYGDDRAAVLAAIPATLGVALNQDHTDIADSFLAGLRLPDVHSPF
jgi:hypothetical protein